MENNSTVAKCIAKLIHSRDIAHLFHWQTTSFAKHLAAEGYYTEILELTDFLVETYQGKYGLLQIQVNADSLTSQNAKDLQKYLTNLLEYLEMEAPNIFKDSDALNIIDEIKSLIKKTLYKLKFLS